MGVFMNGKLLDLKIVRKTVQMMTHHKTKSTTYQNSTDKFEKDGTEIFEYAGQGSKTTYENYTKTEIDCIDEKTNEKYKGIILEDDFLPIENSTIKFYVNDDKKILGYVPYKNADPILIKNVFPNLSFFDLGDFAYTAAIFSIPVLSLISIFEPKKLKLYNYSDGNLESRSLLKALLYLILIIFNVYFTYYWYTGGAKVFLLSMLGYISGGIIISTVVSINRVINCINIKKYAYKIKKQLRGV
jgi:hypothetical protein